MNDASRNFGRGLMAVLNGDGGYVLENSRGERITEGSWEYVFRAAEGVALAIRDGRAYYIDFTGRLIQEGDWLQAGCFSEDLAVCGNREGLRFFDRSGRVVLRLDSRWREARGFHEGLAAVAEGEPYRQRWGYINRKGELVMEPKWEIAGDFSGGVAVVGRNRRFAVIDRSGRELIPAELQYYPPEDLLRELREGK